MTRERPERQRRSTFVLTLRAPRDADDASAVRALRAVLKLAWRRFGLRAVDVHEVVAPDVSNQVADVFTEQSQRDDSHQCDPMTVDQAAIERESLKPPRDT